MNFLDIQNPYRLSLFPFKFWYLALGWFGRRIGAK